MGARRRFVDSHSCAKGAHEWGTRAESMSHSSGKGRWVLGGGLWIPTHAQKARMNGAPGMSLSSGKERWVLGGDSWIPTHAQRARMNGAPGRRACPILRVKGDGCSAEVCGFPLMRKRRA